MIKVGSKVMIGPVGPVVVMGYYKGYPIVEGIGDHPMLVEESRCAPVPEPRWVDVTATFNDGNHDGWHGISNGESNIVITGRHAGYRLRKVRFQDLVNHPDAFIIERQQ